LDILDNFLVELVGQLIGQLIGQQRLDILDKNEIKKQFKILLGNVHK
jgi:hypothetical protein